MNKQREAFKKYIQKVPYLKDTWTGWRLELLIKIQPGKKHD